MNGIINMSTINIQITAIFSRKLNFEQVCLLIITIYSLQIVLAVIWNSFD